MDVLPVGKLIVTDNHNFECVNKTEKTTFPAGARKIARSITNPDRK